MDRLKDLFYNKCVVSCTTLTTDIRTAVELAPLIPAISNYHLIAMVPADGFHRKSWQFLADVVAADLATYMSTVTQEQGARPDAPPID